MQPPVSEERLRIYADLAIKIGLNLQPGQRLLIIGPLANGGASLDAAPLVRHLAASAYQAGAPLVETLWGDEALQLRGSGTRRATRSAQFSAWLPEALLQHVEAGHAALSIYANDPDLLKARAGRPGRRGAAGDVAQRASRSASSSRATRPTGR